MLSLLASTRRAMDMHDVVYTLVYLAFLFARVLCKASDEYIITQHNIP